MHSPQRQEREHALAREMKERELAVALEMKQLELKAAFEIKVLELKAAAAEREASRKLDLDLEEALTERQLKAKNAEYFAELDKEKAAHEKETSKMRYALLNKLGDLEFKIYFEAMNYAKTHNTPCPHLPPYFHAHTRLTSGEDIEDCFLVDQSGKPVFCLPSAKIEHGYYGPEIGDVAINNGNENGEDDGMEDE